MDSRIHLFKSYALLLLALNSALCRPSMGADVGQCNQVLYVPVMGASIRSEEGLNCVISMPANHMNDTEYCFRIKEGSAPTSFPKGPTGRPTDQAEVATLGDFLIPVESSLEMTCKGLCKDKQHSPCSWSIHYTSILTENGTLTRINKTFYDGYGSITGKQRHITNEINGTQFTLVENGRFIVTLHVVRAGDKLIDILETSGQSWCNLDETITGATDMNQITICDISEPTQLCDESSSPRAQQIGHLRQVGNNGAADNNRVIRINLISSYPESCATVMTAEEEITSRTTEISTPRSENATKPLSSQATVSTLAYPNITFTASMGGTSQKSTTSGEETTNPLSTNATTSYPTTQPIITTNAFVRGKPKSPKRGTLKGPPGVVVAAVVVGMIIFLLLLVLAATVYKKRRISRSPNENAQPKTSTIITNQAYEGTNDNDQLDYEAITDSPSVHIDSGLLGDGEPGSHHFTSNQVSVAHEIIEYSEIGEQDYNVLCGGKERGNYHQYTLIPDSGQNKLKKGDFQKKEENYQELLKDEMCQEFDEPKPSGGNAICATRGHLLDVEEKGANSKEIAGTSRATGNHIYQPLINVGGNKSSNQKNVQLLMKPENKSSDQIIGSSSQPLQVCGPEYATLEPGSTDQHLDLASVTTNGFQSVERDTSNPDHAVLEPETLGNGESDEKIGSRRQSLQDCGPEYATLEPGTTDHSLDPLTSPANGFQFLNTETSKPAHAVLEPETLRNGDSDQTIDSRRQSQQDCGPEYATLEPGTTGQHLDLASVTTNGFQSIERDTGNPDYAVLEPETSKNERSDQAMDTRRPGFGRHQSLQDGRPGYATLEPDTTDHSLGPVTSPPANGFQSLNKRTSDSEYDALEFGTSGNDFGKTLDEENKRLDHAHQHDQGQHETQTCQSGISVPTMTESSYQPYDVLQRDFKAPRESTPSGYGSLGQID